MASTKSGVNVISFARHEFSWPVAWRTLHGGQVATTHP